MADRIDNTQRATLENELYTHYVDYPPTYNDFNNQLVERDLDNALACIFRSFYGSRTLLPEVPNLFIDIERYTHSLDTLSNRLAINTIVNEVVWNICGEMSPQVDVEYDKVSQLLTYKISLEGEFLLKVEAGETLRTARIINDKKFYE